MGLTNEEYQTIRRDKFSKKYPFGMHNFIWILLGTDFRNDVACLPGQYLVNLVVALLNTYFEDQSIYEKVGNLPRDQQLLCIDCLSYHLGLNNVSGNALLAATHQYKLISSLE